MEIYFIRHGETLWNTLKIFQGRSDSPLTELGISQAEKLSEKLKDIEFTDKPVAVVRYRDGTVIDTVYQVKA